MSISPENAIREAEGIEKAGSVPRDVARTASEKGRLDRLLPAEPEVGALAGATQAPIIVEGMVIKALESEKPERLPTWVRRDS